MHGNARRGSGGVGVLIREELYDSFEVETVDRNIEGILWICFKCKYDSDFNFSIAAFYLPPSDTRRPNDQEKFFENLLQVYCNQSMGNTIICGDFNSRCGYNTAILEKAGLREYFCLLLKFLFLVTAAILNGGPGC